MAADGGHLGCCECGRMDVQLKKDGTLRHHVRADSRGSSFLDPHSGRCRGSGRPPRGRQFAVQWVPGRDKIVYSSREEAEAEMRRRRAGVLMGKDYEPVHPRREGTGALTGWYEICTWADLP